MESFELKVDTNSIYIRIIRFLGTLMLGFFIGALLFKYRYEGTVDWMNIATGIMCSTFFAFFPGAAGKQALLINKDGIFLHNYRSLWGGKKSYDWSSIRAVTVKKNRIELKNRIGSTEKIKFPIHTESQAEKLKEYLREVSASREIEYK